MGFRGGSVRTVPWMGPVWTPNIPTLVRTPGQVVRPDSAYAGRSLPSASRAAAIRRAVKSAARSATSSSGEERRLTDLALLADHPVDQRGVVDAPVEDQAERVVPAAPRRQPVGEQQVPGRHREAELLLDLAAHGQVRRLADLDDAAGQVPVVLVGELAQQHPAVRVAHEHLADRPLAGEERVQQRPEALRVAHRRVVGHPGVHDAVSGRPVQRHSAQHTLAAQPGPGGHPLPVLVVDVHQRLDPVVCVQGLLDQRGQRRHGAAEVGVGAGSTRAMPSATVWDDGRDPAGLESAGRSPGQPSRGSLGIFAR